MSAARAPPAWAQGGRARGADTRRPERVRVRHGPQHPSQSGCGHWPPGPAEPGGAAATAKMQRIVFGARAGARAGGRARRAGGTATGSLSGAPARADRDAEPASESESESDLATGRGRRRDSDSDRDRYRDAEGGPGDHESPEGGDHGGHYSNDEDSQEPGKLYK